MGITVQRGGAASFDWFDANATTKQLERRGESVGISFFIPHGKGESHFVVELDGASFTELAKLMHEANPKAATKAFRKAVGFGRV